jgi:hypothetical protein
MAVSDLQLALIGVGAAAVGGVWAYNKWQERKHRRLAERILRGGDQTDVLLDADAEPATAGATGDADAGEPMQRLEPVIPTATEAGSAGAADSPWADAVADGIGRLEFVEPVAAPAVWAAQAEWAGHLSKPLHWLAQVDGEWRRLTAHDAGRYGVVLVAQQLADRRGAAGEAELTVFAEGVRHLAAQFGGVASVPEVATMLEQARALDELCAGVDVQLSINVVDPGGAAFAGTKLRGLAESAGMQLEDDGRFHACDEQGETLYTLGNLGVELFDADSLRSLATHGITLTLDVPNVGDGPRVFDRMVATARQFAQGLGGVLVDAQRAPLTDAMIAGIRAKIDEIQVRMEAHQIVAGSARARRLFS